MVGYYAVIMLAGFKPPLVLVCLLVCLGVFSANISIGIAPDNEPELAEQFLVRLVSIVEGLPQTIDSNGVMLYNA